MTKFKTYILRFQVFVLAIFVAMLSMGFTYQWEVCTHVDELSVCKIVEDVTACCCATQIELSQCTCADINHNTCDLSFSKYVQFDFEVLATDFKKLVPDVNFVVVSTIFRNRVPAKFYSKLIESEYILPPQKSGRDILCAIQTFLI